MLLPSAILWRLGPGTRTSCQSLSLPLLERLQISVVRIYLFCVGLDLLGGIFLKLESNFLDGFFLSARKSLWICVDEAALGTEKECVFVERRRTRVA